MQALWQQKKGGAYSIVSAVVSISISIGIEYKQTASKGNE
jgi:hypothetical protein